MGPGKEACNTMGPGKSLVSHTSMPGPVLTPVSTRGTGQCRTGSQKEAWVSEGREESLGKGNTSFIVPQSGPFQMWNSG